MQKKHNLSTSFLLVLLTVLVGCEKTKLVSVEEYSYVPLPQLVTDKKVYSGKKISTEGYILGLEHHTDTKEGEIWIFVLGDQPQTEKSVPNQLIFPNVKNKIRVGEDGYNREIITRCHEICGIAQTKNDLIKVYGSFVPSQTFNQYTHGVDLFLNAIEMNGVLVDTDYNDHGKIKEKTPSVLKKIYRGGKSVAKMLKKAVL